VSVVGGGVRDPPWNDPSNLAYLLLQRCKIDDIPEDVEEIYVERKGLEQRIDDHVRQTTPWKYLVIVGPRGGGKTTAVKKTLKGRGKVVYVKLTSEVRTIQARLRGRLGIPADKPFELEDAFKAFKSLHGGDKPVLVVEIDSNVSSEAVRMQSQEMKVLCVDAKLAHGILILSDANATFKLNTDEDRQKLLWIDDLDKDEMDAFLDKFGILPRADPDSAALRLRLWNEVGTNVQALAAMAGEAKTAAAEAVAALGELAADGARAAARRAAERGVVERHIEQKQRGAYTDVKNLLTDVPIDKDTNQKLPDQRWSLLLLTLALCIFPGDIDPEYLGISPINVSTAVKPDGFRAITHDSEAKLSQFYSKAHRDAARRWVRSFILRLLFFFSFLFFVLWFFFPFLFFDEQASKAPSDGRPDDSKSRRR